MNPAIFVQKYYFVRNFSDPVRNLPRTLQTTGRKRRLILFRFVVAMVVSGFGTVQK